MSKQKAIPWWSSPRAIVREILTLDDSPHSIALGTSIGMFLALTPTVGIQMLLVVLLAAATHRFFYFNRVAALITVYVSNPITTIPLYWFFYEVGRSFVGGELTRQDFDGILDYNNFNEWWDTVLMLFIEIGEPLLVGSAIVATIGGVATYPLMLWLLRKIGASESAPATREEHPQPAPTEANPD